MKVWVITLHEPCFLDGKNIRYLRSFLISESLSAKNHQVAFWTSTFSHENKSQRFDHSTLCRYKDNFTYVFVKTPPYYKNYSLMRVINHFQFAKKFAKLTKKEQKPDLILTSYPDIFHSYEAVKYAKRHNIPVVVDIRDMWPEAFVEVVPKPIRPIAKFLISPLYFYVNYIFKNATAVISMLPFCLQWYQNISNIKNKELDRVFHLAYKNLNPTQEELADSYIFWQNYGISKDNGDFIVCFFGSIGSKTVIDLDTVIKAAKEIGDKTNKIKFVLCGAGENLEYYKSIAKNYKNVIFPGWVDANKIFTLLELSSVGLIPYRNRFDFKNTIPNKGAEYLSGGLPILTCLDGYINEFLKPYNCVFHYNENNSAELANIILDLYSNPQKLKQASDGALKAYNDHFNADKVYTEMINYFEKLVSSSLIAS